VLFLYVRSVMTIVMLSFLMLRFSMLSVIMLIILVLSVYILSVVRSIVRLDFESVLSHSKYTTLSMEYY
jgi:hypothetical protein